MCGDNILRLYENHALVSLFLSFFVSISLCSRDVSNGFGSILRVDGARNAAIVFLTRDWCRFISLLHKQVDLSSDEVYKRARARIENRWKRGDECLEWRRAGERQGETGRDTMIPRAWSWNYWRERAARVSKWCVWRAS